MSRHLQSWVGRVTVTLCILWKYLYPYSIIVIFLYFLVLSNQTKNHTLLFYWFLTLIDLNRLVYSWLLLFCFLFMSLKTFLKIVFSMIIWFWYQIISFYFGYYKLDISVFSQIVNSLSKNWVIYQPEKNIFRSNFFLSFLALSLASFLAMYGFDQAYWLNLI